VEYPLHKIILRKLLLKVKSKGWKLPYILVFPTPMNRENLSEFCLKNLQSIEKLKVKESFITNYIFNGFYISFIVTINRIVFKLILIINLKFISNLEMQFLPRCFLSYKIDFSTPTLRINLNEHPIDHFFQISGT
jgi:hypothetical protein